MEPETKARGDQSPKAADQRARETADVLKERASEPLLFAHPCSFLLQLLVRACACCLGLHGYCSDDDGPKPAAVDDDPKPAAAADDDDLKPAAAADDDDTAAPAVAETPEEGAGGGGGDDDEAASYFYLQEVGARVRNRTPPGPGPPAEGPGGDGGKHN